ncbi:MAG: MerR family transcriptional regulator [Oscillospiraceae bacterium]|nr:MerR family transcriptional regulator [Oscillospiraceae bacterium]
MEEVYSTKQFSEISGVEQSTLRYWNEIGIFSPMKRNEENNYRCYALPQLLALNFVTTLSNLGIPLKTIAKLRAERNSEEILKVLEKRERELDAELRTLRLRSSIIHARQELIREGLRVDETQISVVHEDEKALVLWPRNEYQEGDTFIEPLAAFINRSEEHYVNLSFPVGGYWDNLDSFIKEPARPDRFFSVDPFGLHCRIEGDYLTGYARGYYGEMDDLPERMASYAKEHSLTTIGPAYTFYLHEEVCTSDYSKYLAQTCVAVSPNR